MFSKGTQYSLSIPGPGGVGRNLIDMLSQGITGTLARKLSESLLAEYERDLYRDLETIGNSRGWTVARECQLRTGKPGQPPSVDLCYFYPRKHTSNSKSFLAIEAKFLPHNHKRIEVTKDLVKLRELLNPQRTHIHLSGGKRLGLPPLKKRSAFLVLMGHMNRTGSGFHAVRSKIIGLPNRKWYCRSRLVLKGQDALGVIIFRVD